MNKRIENIPGIPVPGVKKRDQKKEKVIQELESEDIEVMPGGEEILKERKDEEAQRMQGVALDADPGMLQRQAESVALLSAARERARALLTNKTAQKTNGVQRPADQVKPTSGIVGWIKGLFG